MCMGKDGRRTGNGAFNPRRVYSFLPQLWTRILLLTISIVRLWLALSRVSQTANMSEANSYAGTIGAWVGGFFVLLLQLLIAHNTSPRGRGSNVEIVDGLNSLKTELISTKMELVACRTSLGNIETILRGCQSDTGGMLVIQQMPRSSTQDQDAAHPQ